MSTKIVATEGRKPIRFSNEWPTTLFHVLVNWGKAFKLFGMMVDKDWYWEITVGSRMKTIAVNRIAKKT